MRVCPNFRIKRAAACIKDAYHLPAHLAESNSVAKGQAGVGLIGVFAHDDFSDPGLKHAALGNPSLLTDLEHVGRNATKLHVGVRSRGDQRNRSHEHSFRSHQWAIRAAGNTWSILNDLYGIEPDAAGHL